MISYNIVFHGYNYNAQNGCLHDKHGDHVATVSFDPNDGRALCYVAELGRVLATSTACLPDEKLARFAVGVIEMFDAQQYR